MPITDTSQVQSARATRAPGARDKGLALAGGLVCLCSVLMAAAGAPSDAAVGRGLLQLLVVGVPIAVGLYALRAPVNKSFGMAMLSIGFVWSLTALGESSHSVLYTIGRISTWLTFPCVVYLLLAFPHGRVAPGSTARSSSECSACWCCCSWAPRRSCRRSRRRPCGRRARPIARRTRSSSSSSSRRSCRRSSLSASGWSRCSGSGCSTRCSAAGGRPRRCSERHGPAFIAGTLLGLFHIAHHTSRQLGAPADTVIALSSAWTLCIVAVCTGFLVGLLWRRMLLAGPGPSGRRAARRRRPLRMRDAVATALGDPTAQLVFSDQHPPATTT